MTSKFLNLVLVMMAFLPYTASAQLKVAADGRVYVDRTVEDTISIMNIGSGPEIGESLFGDESVGLFVHKYLPRWGTSCGIYSEATHSTSTSNGQTIGMCGMGLSNHAIGVMGAVGPGIHGAGIFGSSEAALPPYTITGNYAGYFLGEVGVDGDVSGEALYNTSDMRLNENVVSLREKERETGSALEKLLDLDVIEYNLKQDNLKLASVEELEKRGVDVSAVLEKATNRRERRHFGLSAQELQGVYPNLVKENQNGYLSINYVELVPILIRSIQELNKEIESLKGTDGTVKSRTATGVDKEGSALVRLYQNVPNPFTERTEIHFSLPGSSQDAYVCIYDMTGKMLKKLPVSPNTNSIVINGYELGEGIYLYSLVVNGQEVDTKRMILTN